MKITAKQVRKMEKAAERLARLAKGEYRPTSVHRTSRKDILRKSSNTIRNWNKD